MAASAGPNLGLGSGGAYRDSGWGPDLNNNIRKLDAVVHLSVRDRTTTTPPATPAAGDRYIVAAGATGAWGGQDGNVALWDGGAWVFYVPAIGWLAYIEAEGVLSVYKGPSVGWSAGSAS